MLGRDHVEHVTQFRGRCPRCGDVLLAAPTVVLLLGGSGESYRFECPGCGDHATMGATPATAELLWAAGAIVAAEGGRASHSPRVRVQ